MSDRLSVKDSWHNPHIHVYEAVDYTGMFTFRFEFSNFYESRNDLKCEVTAYLTITDGQDNPPRRILGPMTQNLLSSTWRGKAGLVGMLSSDFEEYGWRELLEDIIPRTIVKLREVEEVVDDSNWERDENLTAYLLQPFVSSMGVTVLFAPGGTGKSTFAAGVAVSVTNGVTVFGDFLNDSGNVLWVDYETTKDEVFIRVAAIRKMLGLEQPEHKIRYIKPQSKFIQSVATIRRHIHDIDAKLVIVDSIANARAGDAISAEDTVALFSVMGHLGVPVLAIDHMSAEAAAKQDMSKPYGTVFTTNQARMTWGMMESELASTRDSRLLNMKQSKQNLVAGEESRGIRINYWSDDSGLPEAIQFEEVEPVWDGQGLTVTQRVLRVLRETPLKYHIIHEVATAGELNVKTAEKELKRLYDEGIVERRKLEGRGGPLGYRERQAAQ